MGTAASAQTKQKATKTSESKWTNLSSKPADHTSPRGGGRTKKRSQAGEPSSSPSALSYSPRPAKGNLRGSKTASSRLPKNDTWVCKVCERSNICLHDSCRVCGTAQTYVGRFAFYVPGRSQASSDSASNSLDPRPSEASEARTHPCASSTCAQNSANPSQDSSAPDAPGFSSRSLCKLTRQEAIANLGLADDISTEEVRKAYKQVALRWHPDRRHNHGNEEEATRRFQEAKEAFDFFCKPD